MAFIDLLIKIFMGQTQKNFDPAEIGQQILKQIKKMLQSLIILAVASVIFCMLVGHLISRSLDLLDSGGFIFSNSIILLLVLSVVDLIVIAYVLKKTIEEDEKENSKANQTPQASGPSPLEGAIAALIIDFVKQREHSRELEKTSSDT